MTPDTLQAATGCTPGLAAGYADPLTVAMDAYQINTVARICAFLAQVGEESGGFRYAREIWGPTPTQQTYQGRMGNTHPGDGLRFLGRGLIMITGRDNYDDVSDALGHDFIAAPADLSLPQYAALSAAWFFQSRGCNELADQERFSAITQKINGGQNGAPERVRRYLLAQATLGCLPEST